MKHFDTRDDCLAYIQAEIVATLEDDLSKTPSGPEQDEMVARLADVEVVAGQIMLPTVSKYRVTDTITYERVWSDVVAVDQDDAINRVDTGLAGDATEEEQIDNTTYEAEEEAVKP